MGCACRTRGAIALKKVTVSLYKAPPASNKSPSVSSTLTSGNEPEVNKPPQFPDTSACSDIQVISKVK